MLWGIFNDVFLNLIMGWTVVIQDEEGNAKRTMPNEFVLSDEEVIYNRDFKLLRYLDPYGDTTFNALMFEDLIKDFIELKRRSPIDTEQIDVLISYTKECNDNVHLYLKFYGD